MRSSIRLYSPFYSSDIIIASPLGLRTVVGAEGETKRDFDFLSSIELLVLEQADVFLMQNWEHVLVSLRNFICTPIFTKSLLRFFRFLRFGNFLSSDTPVEIGSCRNIFSRLH